MIFSITESDWDKMSNVYKKSRKAQTFFSNYNFEDVGVVTLSSSSSSLWTISPPEIDTLKKNLEDEGRVLIFIYLFGTSFTVDFKPTFQ